MTDAVQIAYGVLVATTLSWLAMMSVVLSAFGYQHAVKR